MDEPLLVELNTTPAYAALEAVADDPAGLLARSPLIEVAPGSRTLRLEPGPLRLGEAQITVTATDAQGSASETFRFEVVPPFREVGELFDLTDHRPAGYVSLATAVDGDTLVIGVDTENLGQEPFAGAAYVFEYEAGRWAWSATLTAADGYLGQRFGKSVDISGDLIVVGAPEDDEAHDDAGAAYIFERSGDSWDQVAKLKPFVTGDQDFGYSVAIDGEWAAIGAPGSDSGGLVNNGQVYAFMRGPTSWSGFHAHLSDRRDHDRLGTRVDIDGDLIVAVVPGVSEGSLGRSRGAAYLFEPGNDSWVESGGYTSIVSGELFGSSVAIAGETVAIGAPGSGRPGSIHVLEIGESIRSTRLVREGGEADDFGAILALDGDYLMARADVGEGGQLVLFKRHGDAWAPINTVAASELGVEEIGIGMALTEGHAIVSGDLANENTVVVYLPR